MSRKILTAATMAATLVFGPALAHTLTAPPEVNVVAHDVSDENEWAEDDDGLLGLNLLDVNILDDEYESEDDDSLLFGDHESESEEDGDEAIELNVL